MKDFLKSVCAGAAIGLGGTVFLACDNKYMGAFLFAVGLLTVLIFKLDLFTGKACLTVFLKKPGRLALIWSGNFVGAVLFGLMASTHTAMYEKAAGMITSKFDKPFYVVLIDAFICELCIAIAVRGFAKADGFGRYLLVILGVMVFILCGAEHVVADMFYLAAARCTDIPQLLVFLLCATVGNVAGGIVWAVCEEKVFG